MKDFFGNNIITIFDFKRSYVGYVLDTSTFLKDFKIKVFIPELFGYEYNKNMKVTEKVDTIHKNKISNFSDLQLTTNVTKCNYLECRPMLNNAHINYVGDFVIHHCPTVGSRVLVNFLNGNPLNCYYMNYTFLNEEENLYLLTESGVSIDDIKEIIGDNSVDEGGSEKEPTPKDTIINNSTIINNITGDTINNINKININARIKWEEIL